MWNVAADTVAGSASGAGGGSSSAMVGKSGCGSHEFAKGLLKAFVRL